jgi:serine/threonine protein kinase
MVTEQYCTNCGAINKPDDEHCFACGAALLAEDDTSVADVHEAHLLRQRYRLQAQVGAGGFSAVYKAEDTTNGKTVAIKAISLRDLTTQEKIEATDVFNREVSLLSTLRHRNLPQVLDHFTTTECWYVVMDFVNGTSLEKCLEELGSTRLPLTEIIDIGIVLCEVLEYLHSQQPAIIYRDLKPANIMLTQDGHLFLIDFGVARHFKPGKVKDTIPFGSPGYAAPEQHGKAQTTSRADIYSLGVVLHQLLSGDDPTQHPFTFAPLSQQRPEIASLEPLITRMVALKSDDRPEDIKTVKKELRQFSAQQHSQGLAVYHNVLPSYTHSSLITLGSPFQPSTGYHQPLPPHPNSRSYVPPYQPTTRAFSASTQAGQVMASQVQRQQSVAAQNPHALASLLFSLMGIVFPPFIMFIGASLPTGSIRSPLLWCLFSLTPSILGILLGHIGRLRAKHNASIYNTQDTAITGLAIGYIFGTIYFIFMLCMLSTLWSMSIR